MIKATINSYAGNEFKTSKEVFIWFSFANLDIENIKIQFTFHPTEADALENQAVKTDKGLAGMTLPESIDIKASLIAPFTSFTELKRNIQNLIVSEVQAMNLSHITKIEVL